MCDTTPFLPSLVQACAKRMIPSARHDLAQLRISVGAEKLVCVSSATVPRNDNVTCERAVLLVVAHAFEGAQATSPLPGHTAVYSNWPP